MDCLDIISAVKRRGLLSAGDRVLVAVSGGPDSIAMLHALHARSSELGITLHVAHFNHGLRGAESDMDAVFVADFAHSLGLPITVEKSQRLASKPRASEEAAREARYEFLHRAAECSECFGISVSSRLARSHITKIPKHRGIPVSSRLVGSHITEIPKHRRKIAVGHTADDRAESVLLNLFRGTGVRGLAAIRPVQDNIVRPLIDATRKDVEAYIAAQRLPFRVDESNMDTGYTRNWVRLELIPLLRDRCNPDVMDALARLAEMASDEADLIDTLVSAERAHVQFGTSLDAELMLIMPRTLLSELIRSEIEQVKGDLRDVTYEQLDRIVSALAKGGDFKIALPTGIYASRKANSFRVFRRKARAQLDRFEIPLTIPGETIIEQRGVVICAEQLTSVSDVKTGPDVVTIDADSIVGSLIARDARPGDRITPFGMSGTKKLQDVFTDKKVTQEARDRALVVCDEKRILWVIGIAASEHCRVTGKTRSVIRVRADKQADSSFRTE